jgi:hypothetical protein
MRLELVARREEAEALRNDNESLRARYGALENEWKELGAEVEWQRQERARLIAEAEELREQLARLEPELADARAENLTYSNMKAVRWTARLRRIAYRLRGHGA